MYPAPLFSVRSLRFLLPSGNPLGWSAADFILAALALFLVAALLLWPLIEPLFHRIASSAVASMAFCGALPVVLRLALLGSHPVPTPNNADDFSYLLLGDTLAHFRLANPVHPLSRFFEGVFILQHPSYSSIYPAGQGLMLAFGELVFRNPWAGVLLSAGAFCALCCWMLRGWTAPRWALAGGIIAGLEFGPLSSWMNTYWGGAVSAAAGCLVFGALPRLRDYGRRRDAALLGLGLGLELITRPFEFLLLTIVVAVWFVVRLGATPTRRLTAAILLALAPAAGLTLLQNKAVTGNWIQLPYLQSRYDYGVPTTFFFQPNPVPHRELTLEQQIDYEAQSVEHGSLLKSFGPESFGRWFERLGQRVRFLRFFFFPPLYLALLAFLPSLRRRRFLWLAAAVLFFWAADNFYPYFYPHYVAALACALVLMSVAGLERMSLYSREAARLILLLSFAHFLFWYGIQISGNRDLFIATGPYESSDIINWGDPEGRIAVNDKLKAAPGRQLVFVHYFPQHAPREWIHNEADIDRSRVVWAIDRGADEDAKLRAYYPDRTAWLLEADAHPARLTPF
jgi:predicted PurR-regulated permease PerM